MDKNIWVDAVEAIPKLVEMGIRLIKEGQANRKNFFENFVKPIHESFQELYEEHLKAFKKVEESLVGECSVNELSLLVNNVLLFERSNANKLAVRLSNAVEQTKIKGKLGDLFKEYIYQIQLCLKQPYEKYQASSFYYATLEEIVKWQLKSKDNYPYVLGGVRQLILHFQIYQGVLEERYDELRIHCLR